MSDTDKKKERTEYDYLFQLRTEKERREYDYLFNLRAEKKGRQLRNVIIYFTYGQKKKKKKKAARE